MDVDILREQYVYNGGITVDITKVSTADLHAELVRREGVKERVIDVGTHYSVIVNGENIADNFGPVRILINVD